MGQEGGRCTAEDEPIVFYFCSVRIGRTLRVNPILQKGKSGAFKLKVLKMTLPRIFHRRSVERVESQNRNGSKPVKESKNFVQNNVTILGCQERGGEGR
jgi:hypothetical protein